jgi:hypothetical protein
MIVVEKNDIVRQVFCNSCLVENGWEIGHPFAHQVSSPFTFTQWFAHKLL